MDSLSDSEITGLYMIHEVVRHALTYEIERVSDYRERLASVEAKA